MCTCQISQMDSITSYYQYICIVLSDTTSRVQTSVLTVMKLQLTCVCQTQSLAEAETT